MASDKAYRKFNTARCTYNYCGICGHEPKTDREEMNRGPIRWWSPDDGWKIGSLCRWCAIDEGALDAVPKPDDYAYEHADDACTGEPETDDDPLLAF